MPDATPASVLTLEVEHKGTTALVHLHGKLVAEVADGLYARVRKLIPDSKRIVLDLTDLSNMDSMGLGALVRLYVSAKTAGCSLELINLGKRVRELLGTENDGASRELARYLKHAGDRFVEGLDCLVMLRRDRLGSDGEQTVFTGKGIPGVRVTELVDPFERLGQGTSPGKLSGDTATFFDPGYCARITRMMVAGFRQLSYAPAGPQNVGLGGCGTNDTKLWWTLPEDPRIVGIVLYRRRADGVLWQQNRGVAKSESQVIPGASADTDVFAVATVDTQGNESLPVSPRSIAF